MSRLPVLSSLLRVLNFVGALMLVVGLMAPFSPTEVKDWKVSRGGGTLPVPWARMNASMSDWGCSIEAP
jgi:hypothetical protein